MELDRIHNPEPEANPIDLADVLLTAAAHPTALAVIVSPGDSGHDVSIESANGTIIVLNLPDDLGDALVARIALVAHLDVVAATEQLGRLTVQVDSRRVDLFVLVSSVARGLSVELRRLAVAPNESIGTKSGASSKSAVDPNRLGPYRLLDRLGEGGAGTVYRAEHEVLGKRVAVKVLRPEIAAHPVLATILLREGRVASQAENIGIVNVTDFGSTPDGRTYLVMELVEWPTLHTLLRSGPVFPRRAVSIVRQILSALAAAHDRGVTHRDLKPENIFVSPTDLIKIGDFGSAQLHDVIGRAGRSTNEHIICGSPPYMSPEQAFGAVTDHRSDLYASGCILYEMLTGRVPFTGDTRISVMVQHLEAEVPPVLGPEGPLPDIVDRTVRRALAKKPEARYQSANEMIRDVDKCVLALRRNGWKRWLPT